MPKRLHHWWRCPDKLTRTDYWSRLQHWYASPAGLSAYKGLKTIQRPWLERSFGYYGFQLGALKKGSCWLRFSPIKHHFLLQQSLMGDVQAAVMSWESLAIDADSVDTVMLFHSLETSTQPHEILREVDRVLVPQGRIMLVGFNPWSFIGVWHMMLGWYANHPPWCGRYRSARTLKDWLRLLGYEVLEIRYAAHQPPWHWGWLRKNFKWLDRLLGKWLPFTGGVYTILAKKRVARLTPMKPAWANRSAVSGSIVSEASTRNLKHVKDS